VRQFGFIHIQDYTEMHGQPNVKIIVSTHWVHTLYFGFFS